MSGELVAFLRARLVEDEQVAQAAVAWRGRTTWRCETVHDSPEDALIARHGPARVLAEVEAQRQVVDMHEGGHECPSVDDNCGWWPQEPCPTLRLLALPYSDHPDYRDEWKP